MLIRWISSGGFGLACSHQTPANEMFIARMGLCSERVEADERGAGERHSIEFNEIHSDKHPDSIRFQCAAAAAAVAVVAAVVV